MRMEDQDDIDIVILDNNNNARFIMLLIMQNCILQGVLKKPHD